LISTFVWLAEPKLSLLLNASDEVRVRGFRRYGATAFASIESEGWCGSGDLNPDPVARTSS
jgi:hypothetical protein